MWKCEGGLDNHASHAWSDSGLALETASNVYYNVFREGQIQKTFSREPGLFSLSQNEESPCIHKYKLFYGERPVLCAYKTGSKKGGGDPDPLDRLPASVSPWSIQCMGLRYS